MRSEIGTGTKKLYYDDAYLRSFEGTVLSCVPDGDRYKIVLDQTAFFPEEGGQSPDRGILRRTEGDCGTLGRSGQDGIGEPDRTDTNRTDGSAESAFGTVAQVLDVQIRGGVITHFTDQAFAEGETLTGEIDWAHRFSNMQQHSAEQLYSGLVNRELGYTNVGFHCSDDTVTMDYSGVLPEDAVRRIEREVNEVIWRNIESVQCFPTDEEAKEMDFRSKKEIEGQIRVIIFPDVDSCACCAPHVARTGEIGIFKVLAAQNWKGGTRIHMLAGDRAYECLAQEHAILQNTSRYLTTSTENVEERVRALKEETQALTAALAFAKEQLVLSKIGEMPSDGSMAVLFTDGLGAASRRRIINELMERRGGICALFDRTENGYSYVLGGTGILAVQKMLAQELGAKGGGKEPMIQGSVGASEEAIRAALNNPVNE